eukprot:g1090.t1
MRDVLNSATNLHMVVEIFLRYLREMKTTFSIPFETVTADIDVERDEFSSPQIFVPYVQKILGEETNEEIDDDVSEEDENDDVYDDTGDVSKSPPSRRHLLRDVFALLSRVEKNPENGVSALDLAHSVGPSLCIPKEGAYMSLLHIGGLKVVRFVVKHMVENAQNIFPSLDACDGDGAVDDDNDDDMLRESTFRSLKRLLHVTVCDALFSVAITTEYSPSFCQYNTSTAESKRSNACLAAAATAGLSDRHGDEEDGEEEEGGDNDAKDNNGDRRECSKINTRGDERESDRYDDDGEDRECSKTAARGDEKENLEREMSASSNEMTRTSAKRTFHILSCEELQELCHMDLRRLRQEKRKVKRSLQDFDREFSSKHAGRKPTKQEKEPIRGQYERYNDLKLLIKGIDSVENGPKEAEIRLQLEKRVLQRALRRYELSFESTNGRKVAYRRDIAPVKKQYRRYKELKRAIRSGEQKDRGGEGGVVSPRSAALPVGLVK